jgi:putative methionine-R-sulfoxide reductase with GAF domain
VHTTPRHGGLGARGSEDRCPACDSSQVVPIVYGVRAIGLIDADGHDVEIGDEADTDDARWACQACAHRWSDEAHG